MLPDAAQDRCTDHCRSSRYHQFSHSGEFCQNRCHYSSECTCQRSDKNSGMCPPVVYSSKYSLASVHL